MLEAREVLHRQTPGSGAGVQGENMGSIWDEPLSESLQAAAGVSLPGKCSQARRFGDLCYGPTVFAHSVCGDIIVSAEDVLPSSCSLEVPPPQGCTEGWSWAARSWGWLEAPLHEVLLQRLCMVSDTDPGARKGFPVAETLQRGVLPGYVPFPVSASILYL